MTEPAIFLFVYGTLRRTCATGAHNTYLSGATFINDAKIQARLFRVSYYPAIALSTQDEWVVGEVYRLTNEAQLQTLDDYEECAVPARSGQEYRRELTQVTLSNGETLLAWVYVFNRPTDHLFHIQSGDFLLGD